MSTEAFSLYFLPTTLLSFSLLTLLSLATFLLFPGGLAWAISKTRQPAIPGPSGLPFIGLALAFTSQTPHRILAKLANSTRGALTLMSFSVGSTRFIVSSKPDSAKEILNSAAFADRPVKESAYELLFNRAMGFAPFGEYWRNLRRISSTHLFSPRRVSSFGSVRVSIGLNMLEQIRVSMIKTGEIEIKKVLHSGSLNNVMMIVFGKPYNFGEIEGEILEVLVSEGYELLGVFNWSDHFAPLGWLDLQGVRRRCRVLVQKVNVFVEKIIEDHRIKRKQINGGDRDDDEESSKDFVDVLLDLQLSGENNISDSDMVAVLWEMIFRGTDTVAILLEWILARMVLHPQIQSKAQFEIDSVVGCTRRLVSDSDLPNLPYLLAIIKETLRVHPPGPLLSWARLAVHDTQVGPHFVPAGTTAMVNMWAITHDETIWADPNKFKPERFLQEDVSIMGSDLRLAPFGSGRRVCPGKAMGLVTVQLWLAQMLQGFKWVRSEKCEVELSECLKLSMEMKRPLVCKAIPRVDG